MSDTKQAPVTLKEPTAAPTTATETPAVAAPVAPAVSKPAIPAPPAAPVVDQLEMLKQKADLLGVGYSNSVTVDQLRAKIDAKLNPEDEPQQQVMVLREPTERVKTKAEINAELYASLYEEQMRLVRVRITNMNPQKADLPGEIFCVSNKILGAVRKFIPFGEATDDGWHIPFFIYNELKERQFQQIRTRKGDRGQLIPESRMVKEFAIEVLPDLTREELLILANKQAAADGNGI